ncbi:hypothetical protein DL770_001701 [Monosporascus sp. CRB-9-2]|nr:hypothetical protein DL770_001701 [Monosporascus sp. CRB-9-2]
MPAREYGQAADPIVPFSSIAARGMPPYTRRARATVAGSSEPLLDSDNPDAILSRSRAPKAAKAEAPTRVAVAPDRDSLNRHQLLDNNPDAEAAEPPSLPDSDPWALYYESIGTRSVHYGSGAQGSSASNSEEDSLAALYKRIEYLPPLGGPTLGFLEQVLADPSMGRSDGRINRSEQEDDIFQADSATAELAR